MRIKVKFISQQKPFELPINYNYFITSLIYKILASSSQDYSKFLHDEGYRGHKVSKPFKLFTFSFLMIKEREITGEKIISHSREMELFISSPIDEFVNHLAYGLLQQKEVKIEKAKFSPFSIETLPLPPFKEEMKFICLSPIVVSTMVEHGDDLIPYYWRYDEEGFVAGLRENLLKKYSLVHGSLLGEKFSLEFDPDYIKQKQGRIYKLVDFKGTKIKGVFAPFTARGSPELLKIGYEAGFGEKGSMGFGMVWEKTATIS